MTKKGTKGVYNWDEVFAYYLDMTVSGADVCKRFGMSKSTLDRRIEKYGWAALKKKCGKRAAALAVQKYAKKQAAKMGRLMRASDMLDKGITLMLKEYEGKSPRVSRCAQDLRQLAAALKDAVGIAGTLWQVSEGSGGGVEVSISDEAEKYGE